MLPSIVSKFKSVYVALFVTHKGGNAHLSSSIPLDGASGEEVRTEESPPRYPPMERGIKIYTVDKIIETQRSLIDRIKITVGVKPEIYEVYYYPVICNLARYIHLLPSTKNGNHRGAGGLFRLCLEMALYSAQAANSTVFINKNSSSAEERLKLYPRWVYATFVSGACCEIYRAITDYYVVDNMGAEWCPFLEHLYDWAEKRGGPYHVIWNPKSESDVVSLKQATTAYLIGNIVPPEGIQYICDASNEVFSSMTVAVTNATPNGQRNQIQKIIYEIRRKVVERDLKNNAEMYGDFSVGAHLEPSIVDAMRKLIRKGTWAINVKGARVWVSQEGCFIVWTLAPKEIVSTLKDNDVVGIPTEPETIADILVNAEIAEPTPSDHRYWDICLPSNGKIYSAIKLAQPELIFQNWEEIPVLDVNLLLSTKVKRTVISTPDSELSNLTIEHPNAESISLGDVDKDTGEIKLASPAAKSKTEINEPSPNIDLSQSQPKIGNEIVKPDAPPSQLAASSPTLPGNINDVSREKNKKINGVSRKLDAASERGADSDAGFDVEASERMLKNLPPEAADITRAVIDDYRKGNSTGPVFSVEFGVAISMEELDAHGVGVQNIIKAYSDKNWLWLHPDKPLRKVHEFEHSGKKINAIVVKLELARILGFDWKKPKG